MIYAKCVGTGNFFLGRSQSDTCVTFLMRDNERHVSLFPTGQLCELLVCVTVGLFGYLDSAIGVRMLILMHGHTCHVP